jgi:hypothetical protein
VAKTLVVVPEASGAEVTDPPEPFVDADFAAPAKLLERVRRALARLAPRPQISAETSAARSYRKLARRIISDFPSGERGRHIVVCAVGSTRLCTEAMLMLAHYLHDEHGDNILLVDDTVRGDNLSQRLDLQDEHGLLDLIHDEGKIISDVIRPTAQAGVWILPMGQAEIDWLTPAQLRRIPRVLQETTRQFAYVLAQQSSILDDRRHRFFTAGADLSLLLVEEGATSMEELEHYKQAMLDAQAKTVRVALCSIS